MSFIRILNILFDDWRMGIIYKFWFLFILHMSSARKLIRSQKEKLTCLRKEKLVWQRVSQHFIPGDNVFQQLPQSSYCSSMLLGKTTRWVTILIAALLCNTHLVYEYLLQHPLFFSAWMTLGCG